jgi:hypothetical protein
MSLRSKPPKILARTDPFVLLGQAAQRGHGLAASFRSYSCRFATNRLPSFIPPKFFCSRVSRLAAQVGLAGVVRQYSYTVQQKREWNLAMMGLRDPQH